MKDFKDPKFFINAEPLLGKVFFLSQSQNSFVEAGKINQDDIQTHIIAEDTEDLVKSRKNYVWDKSKKRFVIGKLNEKGDL